MKLNIGCGSDYREGYINIDGSSVLSKVDQIINLSSVSLFDYYHRGSIDFILANDFIEHHFHWEAIGIMKDFYTLLRESGKLSMRVPDCDFIISHPKFTIKEKLWHLFGGQEHPQGDNMDKSRTLFPEYFCHKYGWTREEMGKDLADMGFKGIRFGDLVTNFIVTAKK